MEGKKIANVKSLAANPDATNWEVASGRIMFSETLGKILNSFVTESVDIGKILASLIKILREYQESVTPPEHSLGKYVLLRLVEKHATKEKEKQGYFADLVEAYLAPDNISGKYPVYTREAGSYINGLYDYLAFAFCEHIKTGDKAVYVIEGDFNNLDNFNKTIGRAQVDKAMTHTVAMCIHEIEQVPGARFEAERRGGDEFRIFVTNIAEDEIEQVIRYAQMQADIYSDQLGVAGIKHTKHRDNPMMAGAGSIALGAERLNPAARKTNEDNPVNMVGNALDRGVSLAKGPQAVLRAAKFYNSEEGRKNLVSLPRMPKNHDDIEDIFYNEPSRSWAKVPEDIHNLDEAMKKVFFKGVEEIQNTYEERYGSKLADYKMGPGEPFARVSLGDKHEDLFHPHKRWLLKAEKIIAEKKFSADEAMQLSALLANLFGNDEHYVAGRYMKRQLELALRLKEEGRVRKAFLLRFNIQNLSGMNLTFGSELTNQVLALHREIVSDIVRENTNKTKDELHWDFLKPGGNIEIIFFNIDVQKAALIGDEILKRAGAEINNDKTISKYFNVPPGQLNIGAANEEKSQPLKNKMNQVENPRTGEAGIPSVVVGLELISGLLPNHSLASVAYFYSLDFLTEAAGKQRRAENKNLTLILHDMKKGEEGLQQYAMHGLSKNILATLEKELKGKHSAFTVENRRLRPRDIDILNISV